MKSQRKNPKRNVREKVGRTARCPGCEQSGNLSEECQKRIEKEMIDTGDVIDTEAVKKTNTHSDSHDKALEGAEKPVQKKSRSRADKRSDARKKLDGLVA